MPNKGTAKRRAPKGVLGRLIRTLFGFYPVLAVGYEVISAYKSSLWYHQLLFCRQNRPEKQAHRIEQKRK